MFCLFSLFYLALHSADYFANGPSPRLRNFAHSKMASDTGDELVLTDRDLISLYMKYPEMSSAFEDYDDAVEEEKRIFDATDNSSATSSSPTSSFQTISTAETTPPRFDPETTAATREVDGHQTLLNLLKKAGFPPNTRNYLISVVGRILQIAGLLLPSQGTTTTAEMLQEVLDHCHVLIGYLKFSCNMVGEQLANLVFVKSLAPFNILPEAKYAWTNYCQIAELLIT